MAVSLKKTITASRLLFGSCHFFYLLSPRSKKYIFKTININTRKRCEICSKLTIKTLQRRQYPVDIGRKLNVHKTFRRRPVRLCLRGKVTLLSLFSIFHFLSHLFLRILLFLLNRKMFAGILNSLNSYNSLTLEAPISQNGQTYSTNSSANCRRIVWVRLTILWDWCLKG